MPKLTLDNSFRFGSRRETITNIHFESIETILKTLTKEWLEQFAREEQIQADLIGWKKMLVKINEVRNDAVEKQTKKESVKKWLGELRILACDVDYLMDEFQIEAFQNMLLQDNRMAMSKVKEVNARLQDIASQIEPLDLGKKSAGKSRNVLRKADDDDDKGRQLEEDDDDENMPSSGEMVTPNYLKAFTFPDLRVATRNFGPDTLLGEGGFGKVFKGWVDHKTLAPTKFGVGMAVAVKKYEPDSLQGFEEWLAEVQFLGKISHPNIIKLIGYCCEETKLLLAYEYMQKGSLANHLFRRYGEPLPWNTRLKIAMDAAKALAFLHSSEMNVLHRNFKSFDILLDGAYNAKLSDFGLAKCIPIPTVGKTCLPISVMGTNGYADPEYVATGRLDIKSDVYGFGVVLLEMLTGLRALDTNRPSGEHNLIDFARPSLTDKRRLKKIMDPRLAEQYPIKAALLAGELIIKCLEAHPKNRPSMEQVLETLQTMSAIEIEPKKKAKGRGNFYNNNNDNQRFHLHNRRSPSPLHSKHGDHNNGTRARRHHY